jgi:hypothetical protein
MLTIKGRILSFIKSSTSGTIIISDIGINNESHLPVSEAPSISKQNGFSNIWIDHQLWPEEMEELVSLTCEIVLYSESGIGSNLPKKCATELCIERFAPTSLFAKTLGFIAHRTDFLDSSRFPLPPLTGLIS